MSNRIRPRAVAEITSLSIRKVQELAAAGTIPGAAKLGGVWTFDPVRLHAWIREQEDLISARRSSPVRPIYTPAVRGTGRMPEWEIETTFNEVMNNKRKYAAMPAVKRRRG